MSDIEPRSIDWAGAEIEQGTLTVALTGRASKGWDKQFDGVLALLGQRSNDSRWGEVKLAKKTIRVSDVQPGAEADLRHLLESAIQQVNADLSPDDENDESQRVDQSPQQRADQEMTYAFRAFAEETTE